MTIRRDGRLYRVLRLGRNQVGIATRRLAHVDRTSYVHRRAAVSRDLRAESYVFIAPGCRVAPMTTIGRYTMLAPEVLVVGSDHRWDEATAPIQFSGRPEQLRTVIGRDVWVGTRAIVLRGVTIGDGAIIGAGAVVTRDVPPREIWAGVPAVKVRERFPDEADRAAHHAMVAGPVLPPHFVAPMDLAG